MNCPVHHRRRFLALAASLPAVLMIPPARAQSYTGKVLVNGRAADPKKPIRPGDRVEVASGGNATFVVGQDAYNLRRGVLQLEADATGALVTGLRLLTGAITAVFGKGPKKVYTPIATAGIRGTGVHVEAMPDSTYFCTCYGEVSLADAKGTEEHLVVSSRHAPMIVYGEMKSGHMMEKAGLKGHTDEDLSRLEALVGRRAPWDPKP